jgi:hypothetical protein
MTPDRLMDAVNRAVTPDELQRALEQPIAAAERDEALDLVRWFTTRYASSEARLAYVRQAYERWAERARKP